MAAKIRGMGKIPYFSQNFTLMKTLFLSVSLILSSFLSLAQNRALTLEESVMGQFSQFGAENLSRLSFLPNSENYIYLKDQALIMGNAKGVEKPWLTLESFKAFANAPQTLERMPAFQWQDSQNANFQDKEGRYYLVNFKERKVTSGIKEEGDGTVSDYHATSQRLAYSSKNNLFVLTSSKAIQVTDQPAGIVSGQSVSRNEYGIEKGTFWNDEGSMLAFYEKDERNVTEYPLTDYTTTPASTKNIRYPMAGATSEKIRVGVFNVANEKTVFLELNSEYNDQYYATNVAWSPDNTLYVVWMNRKTDECKLIAFDPQTGKQRAVLFTEKDDKWVEPSQPIIFIPGQPNQFLWYSYRDGFHQWYKYNTSGTLLGSMKVAFEMTEWKGFDAKGQYGFAMGTGSNATESHLFRVRLSDMFTEQITRVGGVHNVSISGSGKVIIDNYSNLTTPRRIDLMDMSGKIIKNMLTAKNPYEGVQISNTELLTIPSKSGMPLHARVIKPSNFDSKKKYPVVIYTYNGPHVQLVTNSFLGGASLWMHYLAEKGYIVFTVDGRGSMNRGKAFEQAIHRQLGTAEVEDQLAGVEWLKSQSYVDGSRIGVHGWSFGGFMTTSLLLKSPDTFKVGVAGGPVIDWNLYEVMYTERYMDTPQENPEGYANADLTKYVKNLKGKLLMIHGADDDVVVMQHNMRFLKACVDNGVQVDFFTYPGHQHNVRGKDRVHLMKKVIDYLTENL